MFKFLLRPLVREVMRDEINEDLKRIDDMRKDIRALGIAIKSLEEAVKSLAGDHAGYSREMYQIRTDTESTIQRLLDETLIRIGAYEDATLACVTKRLGGKKHE